MDAERERDFVGEVFLLGAVDLDFLVLDRVDAFFARGEIFLPIATCDLEITGTNPLTRLLAARSNTGLPAVARFFRMTSEKRRDLDADFENLTALR